MVKHDEQSCFLFPILKYYIFRVFKNYYGFMKILGNLNEIGFEESKSKINFTLFRIEIEEKLIIV